MLYANPTDKELRLFSIDPGTDTTGLCFAVVDLEFGVYRVEETLLLQAERRLRFDSFYQDFEMIHGSRQARLRILADSLEYELARFSPHDVVCESPFIVARQISAFEPLVQILHHYRLTVHRYDPRLSFNLIAPVQAKKAIGMSKPGQTKSDMREGLIEVAEQSDLTGLYVHPKVRLGSVSEHEIDAIIVGYAQYLQWMDEVD